MTLPAARSLRAGAADKATPHVSRRRAGRLSAAWADLPAITAAAAAAKKSTARRAVCSWHVDYGTLLQDRDDACAAGDTGVEKEITACKKEKVAEYVSLLDPSAPRIRPTKGGGRHSTSTPVPTHTNAIQNPPAEPNTRHSFIETAVPAATQAAMPSLKSLLSKGRGAGGRNGENSNAATPLVKTGNGEVPSVIKPATSLASLRKCETVLALTGILRSASSSSSIEPLQPLNRLRVRPDYGQSHRMCSRCSSLLTLASGSRYSLDSSNGGFVRLASGTKMTAAPAAPPVLCKLCLSEVPAHGIVRIAQCNCSFCGECMKTYVEFEIAEGAYDISCPDAQCPAQGVLHEDEIGALVGTDKLQKHKKYRLNREVELDKNRCWCPRAGCETVCNLCPSQPCSPQSVFCPTCSTDFCSNCKLEWHAGSTCDEYGRRLASEGRANPDIGIPFDSDLIKCCPMCGVPIEKDEGCAQMMCKRCKHVFCWYCLASLDDDFLLRHYDKGPCKNKLGHSRASVIWHRTQVIGIFAGFGILLLVASPLLLLAAPCIVCCKCRICSAETTKLDNDDEEAGLGDDS
ncbi:uncharacterized protein LOC132698217 [Cylas formicarius]|uniref:uncharacterized protein LOC132698217 n=1 Tax=Cylas formicarius TaxID=197179 RepID=UPI0029587C9C|nr:uncharacterized protein LOC132698217 [Cylas formicarius]XP_060520154.1 uncharacterized protein LOC132698217 [Cylas formicarius]XP_060520155.1 uncharacterized protein LOC132698217 [Cylas formicarius]